MFCPKCGTELKDNYCQQCELNVEVIRNEIDDNVVSDGNYDSMTLNTSAQGQTSPVDFNKEANKEKQNPSIDQKPSKKLSCNARPENIMREARIEATKQGLLIQDYLKKKGLTKSQIEKLIWESNFKEWEIKNGQKHQVAESTSEHILKQDVYDVSRRTSSDTNDPRKESSAVCQEPRPWVRYWARTLDVSLFSICLYFLFGLLFPAFTIRMLKTPYTLSMLIFSIGIVFILVFIEALIIAVFGNTPAKAILKTKITNSAGNALSFAEALKRNFYVYFVGCAMWLPLISLATYFWQYRKLKKDKKTSWDNKYNLSVVHSHFGGLRITACVGVYVGLLLFWGVTLSIVSIVNNNYYKNKYQYQNVAKSPSNEVNYVPSVNEQPVKVVQERNELFEAWNKQNPWYGKNQEMTQYADSIGNKSQNESLAEILRKIDEAMRQRWPEKYDIRQRQNDAEAHYNLGRAYANSGRYQEAIEAYKESVRLRPDFSFAHNNLGLAYDNLGRHQEAIEAYKEAIHLKPDYAEAYCGLGIAYGELGRHQEEIEAYKEAIHLKPDYAEAYCGFGIAYNALGQYHEAIDAFRYAIHLKPDAVVAYNSLGRAHGALGQYHEAIDAFRYAIHLKPDYSDAHYNLGLVMEAYKKSIRPGG